MTIKKESITITVPNNTTKEEIKEIRKIFKNQYESEYKLNILISGKEEMKSVLADFLLEKVRTKL